MERWWTSGRTWALMAGDAVALTVFAAVGRRSHGDAAGLEAVLAILGTAAPFVAGWLAAGALLGAFRDQETSTVGGTLRRTALVWTAGFPVAATIRALALWHVSAWTFYAVAGAVPLLMLIGWRSVFVLAWRRHPGVFQRAA